MSERAAATRPWPVGDERGFVMVMVLLLLFAVAVAGATGYQLVSAEADLTSGTEEAQKALSAARAGLERYVGEHIGVPGDTTTYIIGDAVVFVRPTRLVGYTGPSTPDLYLIESVGAVVDPRYPQSPARRYVAQYARLHKRPVNVLGTVMSTATNVDAGGGAVEGNDQSPAGNRGTEMSLTTGNCSSNQSSNIYGTVARTAGGSNPSGGGELALGTAQAVIDSASVAWSIIQDPNFPVAHEWGVSWPPFSTYPDSFFVARYNGDLSAGASHSGRGVLIVTGSFSIADSNIFAWQGIVLAGGGTSMAGSFNLSVIHGALVIGLDGGSPGTFTVGGGVGSLATISSYSCYVSEANRVLAYLELISGSRWEF